MVKRSRLRKKSGKKKVRRLKVVTRLPFRKPVWRGKPDPVPAVGSDKLKSIVKKSMAWHNRNRATLQPTSNSKIIFGSYEEAYLWLDEFLGQISDGKYENANIKWEHYDSMEVKVDEKAKTHIVGTKPSRALVFRDLMWLFDGDRASDNPKSARAVFSRVSDSELKKYIVNIERALR